MKPKNFFKIYANAVERLDVQWFGCGAPEYSTAISARLMPQLTIGVLIVLFIGCGYGHSSLTDVLGLLSKLAVVGLFLWYSIMQVKQDRADGLKRNYYAEFAFVFLGGIVFQHIMSALGMFFLYEYLLNGGVPGYSFSAYFFSVYWLSFPLQLLFNLCCIGIWLDHLYRHWHNLASWKPKLLYVLFSWAVMVVGTQLFGIAMVFGYVLYLIGWVLFWYLFIMIFGSKGNRRSGSYTLDDGTQVKEQTGLFGDKSYRGSDGSDYTTSDGGETFTKR